jgi:hypothetical protein
VWAAEEEVEQFLPVVCRPPAVAHKNLSALTCSRSNFAGSNHGYA